MRVYYCIKGNTRPGGALSSASWLRLSPAGAGAFCRQVCPSRRRWSRLKVVRWKVIPLCFCSREALEKGRLYLRFIASAVTLSIYWRIYRMLGRSQEVDEPGSVRSTWQFGRAYCKHIRLFCCHCLK